MSELTVMGTIRAPFHGESATIVKVESQTRRETYAVQASASTRQGDWWVYVLRATGWICIAALKEGEDVNTNGNGDPLVLVGHVERLLGWS